LISTNTNTNTPADGCPRHGWNTHGPEPCRTCAQLNATSEARAEQAAAAAERAEQDAYRRATATAGPCPHGVTAGHVERPAGKGPRCDKCAGRTAAISPAELVAAAPPDVAAALADLLAGGRP
jgi:hypothetical protein